MAQDLLDIWRSVAKPVIGMLHLLPLPGAPDYRNDLDGIRTALWRDADALVRGGVDGLMLENFGDRPFFPDSVAPWTTAHMAALATEARRRFDIPLGINVLRNDGRAALAVAHAAGAQFIRVNVLAGARVTDQGLLQGIAHELMRDRAVIGAEDIKVFADVNVKHSAPLGEIKLEEEVADLVDRAGADAIIVSGSGTGKATDGEEVERVKKASGGTPVLVGSGVNLESVKNYLPHADGFIIGSHFKVDGKVENPVDAARVQAFMKELR
jgi:membrane complex biogenesis BtpA family protein